MENTSSTGINLILLKITAFFEMLKIKAEILSAPLKPYIEPYEQQILLCTLVMSILMLIVMVRRRLKKKSKSEIEDSEKEVASDTILSEKVKEKAEEQAEPEIETIKEKPAGILKNLRTGLSKTRKAFSTSVDKIFSGGKIDDDMLEDLEELLITSDVGVKTSLEIIEALSEKSSEIKGPEDLKKYLKEEILKYVNIQDKQETTINSKPHVMMVVGVNGVGKTTTIGKLAAKFVKEGKKVLIVAADTFRAAASDQLKVWAERSGADIVRHKDNSDPSAVAFDGMDAAIARGVDIVIIDTAGRLHTKKNLMEELKKIERTISKKIPEAPHETLMVVDATTGQNALQQAKLFNDAVGISTIALTKLDGTAKGGIVIGITNTLNIPLKYVGVGEQVDDLQDFDPVEFADAMI